MGQADMRMEDSLTHEDESSTAMQSPRTVHLDSDRDLTRIGRWLVGLGAFSAFLGALAVIGFAIVPALLIVGAGLGCAFIGVLALGLVAHHQG